MILDRISYKKVFPISSFCTEHIGLEATLDDKENPEEALNKLKVMVDTLHAETLTHLDLYRGTTTRTIEQEEIYTGNGSYLEAINSCTSLKALQIFEKLVSRVNIPEVTEAYNNKLKTFQ